MTKRSLTFALSALFAVHLALVGTSFGQGVSPNSPKPKPAKAPTSTPAPVAAPSVPVLNTSLVSPGGDAARRWITPFLHYTQKMVPTDKIVYDSFITPTIVMINPDAKASTRVRIICYDRDGKDLGSAFDDSIGKLAMKMVHPKKDSWCRLDSTLPIIAYAEIDFFSRRHTPSHNTEYVVRFFKSEP